MKKTLILIFTLIITSSVFSQNQWWVRNARFNLCGTSQIEVTKVAGNFSPAISLSIAGVVNEVYYFGFYGTKKITRGYDDYGLDADIDLSANYKHAGFEFIYMLSMGRKYNKNGLNSRRKIKLSFGLRAGGGVIWFDNDEKKMATDNDYFYTVQPSAGVVYALNNHIQLNGGVYMSSAIKINKLKYMIDGEDFFGPGAFLGVKVSLFRTKKI